MDAKNHSKLDLVIKKLLFNLAVFFYKTLNFLLNLLRISIFLKSKIPDGVKNIIIFRTGNIGDAVCAIPSILAVKRNFPKARVTLLSSPGQIGLPGAKDIFIKEEYVNELIIYYKQDIKGIKGKRKLVRQLRKYKFDLFIELPQNMARFRDLVRNIIFAKLLGVKYAFGFQIDNIKIFPHAQSIYASVPNEVDRLLGVLVKEGLGLGAPVNTLFVPEADKIKIKEFISSLPNDKFVIIHPHAKRQTNLWPPERFAEVAQCILKDHNMLVLITGGAQDADRAQALKDIIGDRALNCAGNFNILQTAELLKYSRLLISNDTGVVHIAALLNIPVVGIYSSWQIRGRWYPYGKNHIVIRKEPACHTCFKDYCGHLTCLKMISVDDVCKAVTQILAKT